MKLFYVWTLVLVCLCKTLTAAAPRVAFLPSFTDFDQKNALRTALTAYDARLQAELLAGWNAEVLGRSGLSTVVFEQKLRSSDQASAGISVLPADTLVLSVLDLQRNELRVHLNAVKAEMKAADAKVFKVKNADHLATGLPEEVSRYLATSLKLSPAAPTTAPSVGTERLTCALLEPVSAGGAREDKATISPLIRAVLEPALASDPTGLELVERSEAAKLLEEKALGETWNPNAASKLGRLVKADLVLVPFIYYQDAKRIHTHLFALDVATGRVLACQSWSGAPLDPPPADKIHGLLAAGAAAARESKKNPIADNPSQRHAEAKYLLSLSDSWLGLRQSIATEAELALRLLDAGLALSHDDPALMSKLAAEFALDAVPSPPHALAYDYHPHRDDYREIRELEKSGQLALIRAEGRRILEIPLTERAKTGDDWDKRRLASLYLGLGEPDRALQVATDGKPLAEMSQNDAIYERIAEILMAQKRYQECIDLVKARKKWSRFSTFLLGDAYRATGNKKEEFLLWHRNPVAAGTTKDRLIRYLELGRESEFPKAVIARVVRLANAWTRTDPLVVGSFIRTRVAAGQSDMAASEAQCIRLVARKKQDSALLKQADAVLKELKVTPLDKLGTPAEVLTFSPDCRIHLIHDQTIQPDYARKVAEHLAGFWGCPVEIRSIQFDAAKSPFYEKVAQSVVGRPLAQTLLRASAPPGPSLGTVFLTHTKLISKERDYVGDIYSVPAGDVTVLSDHYFEKYKGADTRDLSLATAIAAASLEGPAQILETDCYDSDDWSTSFAPLPPDVFTENGVLSVVALDLGVSPYTAALLKKHEPRQLIQAIAEYRQSKMKSAKEESLGDEALARQLGEQITRATPILVSPSSQSIHNH
jgi:hypothetical protein